MKIREVVGGKFDFLLACGITLPLNSVLTYQDVPQLVESLALPVLAVKAELDELMLGLQDAGVLHCIQLYPELFRPVFVWDDSNSLLAGKWNFYEGARYNHHCG